MSTNSEGPDCGACEHIRNEAAGDFFGTSNVDWARKLALRGDCPHIAVFEVLTVERRHIADIVFVWTQPCKRPVQRLQGKQSYLELTVHAASHKHSMFKGENVNTFYHINVELRSPDGSCAFSKTPDDLPAEILSLERFSVPAHPPRSFRGFDRTQQRVAYCRVPYVTSGHSITEPITVGFRVTAVNAGSDAVIVDRSVQMTLSYPDRVALPMNPIACFSDACVDLVEKLESIRLTEYEQIPGCYYYESDARVKLGEIRDKIVGSIGSTGAAQGNFLIYAASGTGKTHLVNRIIDEMGDSLILKIDMKHDEQSKALKVANDFEHANGPAFLFVDEIDLSKPDWNHLADFFGLLELKGDARNWRRVVCVGSSGGSVKGLSDAMKHLTKGSDFLNRIPESNWLSLPIPTTADIMVQAAGRLLRMLKVNDHRLGSVLIEKFALAYLACCCKKPSDLTRFVDIVEAQLKTFPGRTVTIGHLFSPATCADLVEICFSNRRHFDRLKGKIVTVLDQ